MLQFFTNLPPLARLALIGGGTMIGSFSGRLPDALQEVGLLVGVAIASLGIIATIWHWLNERRVKSGKGKLALEPSTLLPAFAVIALVGVLGVGVCLIWQSLRPSVAQAGPPQSAPAVPPSTPLKRMLTAYDVEQRLRAIDDLLELLDPKLMEVSALGERINHLLHGKIANGSAIAALDDFADRLETAHNGYVIAADRYRKFPDINEAASPSNLDELIRGTRLLRANLQEMTQRGQLPMKPEEIPVAFQHHKLMLDWKALTSGKTWTWINNRKQALIAKRHEYEQAEVYPVNKTELTPPSETVVFQWNFDGLLGGSSSDQGQYIAKIWIEGVNRSDSVLPVQRARIISLVTGDSKDMQIRTNKGYVPPDQANPIPPGAKVYLHTLFYDPQAKRTDAVGINPTPRRTPEPEGITAAQFLQQWGSFRFEIDYTHNLSHASWSKGFEYAEIKSRVDAMNPRPSPTPMVTKRET